MPVIEHNGKRIWYPIGVNPEDAKTALDYHIDEDVIEEHAARIAGEMQEAQESEEAEPEEPEDDQHEIIERIAERIMSAEDLKGAIAPLVERIASADGLRDSLREELRQEVEWHKRMLSQMQRPAAKQCTGMDVIRDKKGLIARVELTWD